MRLREIAFAIILMGFTKGAIGQQSSSAGLFYQKGVEMYEASNFDEAQRWMEKELNINPGNKYAQLYIAMIHARNKNVKEAELFMSKVLEGNADNKELKGYMHYLRASMHIEDRDTAKFESELEEALNLNPNLEGALALRGGHAVSKNRYDVAQRDFMRLCDIDPNSPTGYYGLVAICERRKDIKNGLVYAGKLKKIMPENDYPYLYEAKFHMLNRDVKPGIKSIIQYYKKGGKEEGMSVLKGLSRLSNSTVDEAFQKELKKDSKNADWYLRLANIALVGNRFEDAMAWMVRGYGVSHKRRVLKDGMQLYGVVAELKGKEYAKNLVQEYVDKGYSGGMPLAVLDEEDGDLLEQVNKFIEKYPTDYSSYASRGEYHLQLRNYSAALADYEMSVKMDTALRKDADILNGLAESYRMTGNQEMAKKVYTEMLELQKSGDEFAEMVLAVIYASMGDRAEAYKHMRKSRDEGEFDAVTEKYHSARVHARLGDVHMAVKMLQQAVDLGLDDYKLIKDLYDFDVLSENAEFKQLLHSLAPYEVKEEAKK